MLVLSRYTNERVIITAGDQKIVVTLVDVRGNKVRLGFDAPAEVKILREELSEAELKE